MTCFDIGFFLFLLLAVHWASWVCGFMWVCVCAQSLSHVLLLATPPGSSSMGFSRQGYWSGLPFPSPGDLPDPGIDPTSPALPAGLFTTAPPGKPMCICSFQQIWEISSHYCFKCNFYLLLLEVVLQFTDVLFVCFLFFSLCVSFWVASMAMPSSSLIFFFFLH